MNTTISQKCVVDTNFLIGFSKWVPMKLSSRFWAQLDQALLDGKWILLDVVVTEIKFEPEIVKWCKGHSVGGRVCKVLPDHKLRGAAINNQYTMIDPTSGNSETDTYIIAYAEANNYCVVSDEAHRKPGETRFKIPDVCDKLKVSKIRRPEDFLKAINVDFN